MTRICEWLFGVSASDIAGAQGWSVRFPGMPDNPAVLLVAMASLGVLLWLTIRNYRREASVRPRIRLAIAAVRMAILLLLFLTFLLPALMIRFERIHTSAVLVLLDDSLSMRWKDRYTDDKAAAALAQLVSVPADRLTGEDRVSRTEAVRLALARDQGALARLAKDHPLLVYRFGRMAGEAAYVESLGESGDGGDGRALPAPARSAFTNLTAEGQHTDLGRALRETLNAVEGRRIAAVALVSDGRGTTAGDARLAGAAQVARQRGIPVFTVAVGDPTPPGNVAVTQLLGPREVRAASKISFTALVAHRSLPKRQVQIKLFRGMAGQTVWEDTGVAADVVLGGEPPSGGMAGAARNAALQEVALETEAPPVGVYVYKAQVQPLREDSIPDDNEATATVRVTDRKTKILLVGGSPSWEFQSLRTFLLRSKEHYALTVWQQNADSRFRQDASTGMRRTELPANLEELVTYDVVVLCDPRHSPGSMDEKLIGLLDAFVSKHQGGLCYIAGNKFTGKTLGAGGPFAPLGAILPVVVEEDRGASRGVIRDPYPLQITTDGESHPILRLKNDPGENMETWRRMAAVYPRQRVSRIKPLATSLAARGDETPAPGERAETVLAGQHYGRGRVFYIGFDGTWRWRSTENGAYYERFWINAIEFLGSGRLEKKRLIVTTPAETFDAGTEIPVRVEAYNKDMNPMEAKGLVLEARSLDASRFAKHTLRRERPGVYTGSIRLDSVGSYELDVKSDDKGASDWTPDDVATRGINVRLSQAEFWRPEADFDAMRSLATTENGFLRLHEVDALADRIPEGKTLAVIENLHPLWSTKFTLILIGILFLLEWTLRKWFNMM
jgi:hypothetical protein